MDLFKPVSRKFGQFVCDPVLRRWVAYRFLGGSGRLTPFVENSPPYLDPDILSQIQLSQPTPRVADQPDYDLTGRVTLHLSGQDIEVGPDDLETLFGRQFDDIETYLSLHRFAWLPVRMDELDHNWVSAIWMSWLRSCGNTFSGWSWHPYTCAERICNILAYAGKRELPGNQDQTASSLLDHAPVIARNLEYYGDHNTSNHLANNGRGLFVLGLTFDIPAFSAVGADILIHESRRILRPSGLLREGSSHYHVLLTKNYTECWLMAHQYGHAAEQELFDIAQRMLSVIPHMSATGNLPLIGDISPDCPPGYLTPFLGGLSDTTNWLTTLPGERQRVVKAFLDKSSGADKTQVQHDGLVKSDFGRWTGVWWTSPEGWPPMPGHAHQDVGSFVLWYGAEMVICDLGRGSYKQSEEDSRFIEASAHNGLTVDGQNPYPWNKPYYDQPFKEKICGPDMPEIAVRENGLDLSHDGLTRLKSVGKASRSWRFDGSGVTLADHVDGTGRHTICRTLNTTLAVQKTADGVELQGQSGHFKVYSDTEVQLHPTTCWQQYGSGIPATTIKFITTGRLPWEGQLRLEFCGPN